MARIKIDIPEKILGSFIIPIRIADINYGNHVGNDAFVSIIHEARMQWLKQYDYTELKIEGIGLIMSGIGIEFKSEAFYGDVVEVRLGAGDISRVAFDLNYQLFVKRNDENILLANAKTGMVCFDYEKRKVVAIPEKLLTILAG